MLVLNDDNTYSLSNNHKDLAYGITHQRIHKGRDKLPQQRPHAHAQQHPHCQVPVKERHLDTLCRGGQGCGV
jgi:hypothetical protein